MGSIPPLGKRRSYGKKDISTQREKKKEKDGFSLEDENPRRKKNYRAQTQNRQKTLIGLMDQKFRYTERLHTRKQFGEVLKNGVRLNNLFITLIAFENPAHSIARLGLVTKKTIGKAVVRNRVKRRLREIFRTNKHRIKRGLDIILIPKPPITALSYREIESGILDLLRSKKFLASFVISFLLYWEKIFSS